MYQTARSHNPQHHNMSPYFHESFKLQITHIIFFKVTIKFFFLISVFWDLKTCSSVVVYQLCRRTCCFHHHDAGSTPNCQSINHLQAPIIYPDHEGSTSLQKSVFSQTIRRQISEDSKFHNHRCQVPTRLTEVEKMYTLLSDGTANGKWPSFCLLYSRCYLKKWK